VSSATASPIAGGGTDAVVPRHIAIIMDGNGRWAKQRRLPRVAGHRAGMEAVRRTIVAAAELGVETLTLYAFSSENWRRPASEIADLMGLLRFYLKREVTELDRNGVRLELVGDWRSLEPDIVADLDEARGRLDGNRRITVALALNYGAQDELVRAARRLAEGVQSGRIDPASIDRSSFEASLDTADLPPLDLLIRTSGEKRLSNFLLWQAAYAELLFVDTLWPDFDRAALEAALAEFGQRERRYGGR
jgi:undecaprenyl diphosphate synthase